MKNIHGNSARVNNGNRSAGSIAARFGVYKPSGKKNGAEVYHIPCPAHNGKDKNLHIWDGTGGGIAAKCHSHKCSYQNIIGALGVEFTYSGLRYERADGTSVLRRRGPGKDLRRNHGSPDGLKARVWSVDTEGSILVFTEGEKAAHALDCLQLDGYTAAAWTGGAGVVGDVDFGLAANRQAVIWPDADDEGRAAGRTAAAKCWQAGAASVRVVDTAEMPEKSDAADVSAETALRLLQSATETVVSDSIAPEDWQPQPEREPYEWETDGEETWETTQRADLSRMMRLHAGELLALDGIEGDWELLADGGNGVWRRNRAHLQELLHDTRVAFEQAAAEARDTVTEKLFAEITKWRFSRQYTVTHAKAFSSIGEIFRRWRSYSTLPPELSYATPELLDADGRYLGAPNGVVDLQTGALLTGEQARACLVTRQLPDAYEPDAENREDARTDVEKLFAHLPAEERDWLLRCVASALWGNPNRRVYRVVGAPGGGKTTLLNALVNALGEYAGNAPEGLLSDKAAYEKTGPQPELELLGVCRVLIISDPVNALNPERLKRISGGDYFTYRALYSNTVVSRRASATVFMAANYGRVPKLPMEDAGTRERIYTINFPAFPSAERDYDLGRRLNLPDRRQALAAMLIRYARFSRLPPDDTPVIEAERATAKRLAIGEDGLWLEQHIKPSPENWLYTGELFEAYEKARRADTNLPELKQKALTEKAARIVGMGNAQPRKREGKSGRAWAGWQLKTGKRISVNLSDSVTEGLREELAEAILCIQDDDDASQRCLNCGTRAEGDRDEFFYKHLCW